MWFRQKQKFKVLASEILEQKKNVRAPNTYLSARARVARLIKYFGEMAISEITESSWDHYVFDRLTKHPGCKLFDDRKQMFQIILEAFRRGIVSRRIQLRIPDQPGPSGIGREITEEELSQLSLHAPPDLWFQIRIAFLQGMRLREILYLRWNAIDWQRTTIKLLPSDTKTRKGRLIPINPDLIAEFQKRYQERKSPYVFPRKGNLSLPRHDNKGAWQACKKKAGVNARFHDLRHSCASAALRRGASVQSVKKYLGMSEQILTQVYQHIHIDDLRQVANLMSASACRG